MGLGEAGCGIGGNSVDDNSSDGGKNEESCVALCQHAKDYARISLPSGFRCHKGPQPSISPMTAGVSVLTLALYVLGRMFLLVSVVFTG